MDKENKKLSFENKLIKLETIVEEMDSSDSGLDQNLKNFETGIKLYKECKDYLTKIETKIEKLSNNIKS